MPAVELFRALSGLRLVDGVPRRAKQDNFVAIEQSYLPKLGVRSQELHDAPGGFTNGANC